MDAARATGASFPAAQTNHDSYEPLEARALRGDRAPGLRGNGRGLPRARHAARSRSRDQGAPARACRRRAPARPVRSRGARGLRARPPEHRDHLRDRDRRGRRLHGHGARARADAGPAAEARTVACRRGAVHRDRGRRRARGGARGRHRPPRRQARERGAAAGRGRQGPRLRHREARERVGRDTRRHGGTHARRRPVDPDPRGRWHDRLHVPRAGDRRPGRPAQRHLRLRPAVVRDVDGPPGLPPPARARRLSTRCSRRRRSPRARSCPRSRPSSSGSSCAACARKPAGASSTWTTSRSRSRS